MNEHVPLLKNGTADRDYSQQESSGSDLLKDPVCGIVVTEQSPHRLVHSGKFYCFCSEGRQGKFAADPQRYVPSSYAAPLINQLHTSASAGVIYTCPIHPEIRQDHPDSCPKCGMTLEPVLPKWGKGENPELRDFQRRFWWTLPLTVPLPAEL